MKRNIKIIFAGVLVSIALHSYIKESKGPTSSDITLASIKILQAQAAEGPFGMINCTNDSGLCATCSGVDFNRCPNSRYEPC